MPRVVAMAACFACLAVAPAAARAGDVIITLEVPKDAPEPPVVTRGFVPRKANPIMPTRRYDPRPHSAVFLEEVEVKEMPPDATGGQVGGVKVRLLVDALADTTLAVSAGTEIDIENMQNTAQSPRLYSPNDPNLIKEGTINPGAIRTIKPTEAGKAYEIRSRDTGHLVGRVIAFKHRYCAGMRDGKFTIKNVPEGKWKVRVWHGAGFVKMDEPVIDVDKRKEASKAISLPAGLAPGGK
jgi:hypothetical protein